MARRMVYAWREGARVSLNAQIAGQRLEQLKREHRGLVTPEAVVTDARPKRSPLHDHFEWEDSEAAKKYRLDQARELLRSIVVRIDDRRLPDKSVRAFVHVEVPDNGESRRGYMGVREALSNKELRAQVLRCALGELKSWQERYRELREFGDVFEAIEEAEEKIAA